MKFNGTRLELAGFFTDQLDGLHQYFPESQEIQQLIGG